MFLYITLFFLFAGLSFFDYLKFSKVTKGLLLYGGSILSFLIFWALGSLRWKTGTDWDSYYDTVTMFSDIYRILYEPGYGLLLSFLTSFTQDFTVYLAILTFLCLALKFNYFLKYHRETFFTVLLLFLCYYFADIFAVRQNLAISLTLISTIFIIKRKPFLFVVFVGLAASIHLTAVLYLGAYYIYWAEIKDRTFYLLIGISFLFGVSSLDQKLLNLILQVIGVNGRTGEKISGYLNGDDGTNPNVNPLMVFLLGTIKRLIFIPIFLFIKNKVKGTNPYIKGYFNLFMIGNIIYFLFSKDLAVFARASVSFLFFEIFLIGYTIDYFRRSRKTLVVVFTIMLVVALSRFNALINSYKEFYVPYNSIFNKDFDRL